MCLMYGMASYNLYQLYQKEIEMKQVFKFLIANIFFQMVISVLPLSCVCYFSFWIWGGVINLHGTYEKLPVQRLARSFGRDTQTNILLLQYKDFYPGILRDKIDRYPMCVIINKITHPINKNGFPHNRIFYVYLHFVQQSMMLFCALLL